MYGGITSLSEGPLSHKFGPVHEFTINPELDGIKITCTKKTTEFIPYPNANVPPSFCSLCKQESSLHKQEPKHAVTHAQGSSNPPPITTYAPHLSVLQCSATPVKWYYIITVEQEVGVFFDWYMLIIIWFPPFYSNPFRQDVKARTDRVSGACQSKYPTWEGALLKYTQHFDQGSVFVKPFSSGPFDKKACLFQSPSQKRVVIDLCTDDKESEMEELAQLVADLANI
ncbi:hypothetical protein L208DRAFT_1380335 [Tricholoma matsutake]|nr:hypothetical protein L208DRAFT_1380335 [Tricholoma matsutake 945]